MRFLRPSHPDADAVLAPLAAYVHRIERKDHHFFKRHDEGADILPPAFEIKHHIGNALAGAMISVFAAAAGRKNRKTVRLHKVLRIGAGACRIEGRMLDEPETSSSPPSAITATSRSIVSTASL